MRRAIVIVLLVAVVGGGAYFFLNYEIGLHRGPDGKVQYVKIMPRSGLSGNRTPAGPLRPAIRIATFNLARLDEKKLANRQVSNILARVIPQFDLVAVQDVRAKNQGVLTKLVEQINATGRQYDFAVCPTIELGAVQQYSAFLFDMATIEIDRSKVHSVEDPDGRFRHRPLVGLFRAKGPGEAEAFTFKLINVHTDPDRAAAELDLLDDVYRAVRDEQPNEDDVILLGDFGIDNQHLGQLGEIPDISLSIAGTPTTIRGLQPVDNILFDRRATTEFTGRSEVLDLPREFDLTLREAREVSDHLPVWAAFSSYEGGQSGHVAAGNPRTTR